ncbi:hypothetical protein [Mastigocladopsis repens]|uniref:hypothetical protein n=1 Tax=Mastigocladopsis repens TaxID=221287 RepID=UPI0002DED8CE|nr:hypothetical protein [Mastigocladopsis repens]
MTKLPSDLKQVLTDQLKLIATSEKENFLQEITLADQSCLNYTWWVGIENSKLSSDISLQKHPYLIKSEKVVTHKACRYRHEKKTLQHKGTPSIQCRLMARSGRGKKFTTDINNHITKQIVTFKHLTNLEKLTLYLRILPNYRSKEIYNNRGQMTGKRGQCCHLFGVPYYLKRRKANVSQSKWSYAELDNFIHCKAVMNNSSAIRVDADYCSQFHPCCGHTNKHNCPNQGLAIRCSRSRGFELCADLVGEPNVTMRTLLLRHDGCNTGLVVTAYSPKVSLFQRKNTIVSPLRGNRRGVHRMREIRTERLSSFLKPGWSLDTIALKIHSLGLESKKEDFSQQ